MLTFILYQCVGYLCFQPLTHFQFFRIVVFHDGGASICHVSSYYPSFSTAVLQTGPLTLGVRWWCALIQCLRTLLICFWFISWPWFESLRNLRNVRLCLGVSDSAYCNAMVANCSAWLRYFWVAIMSLDICLLIIFITRCKILNKMWLSQKAKRPMAGRF
jgi:hypothetical protein